MANAEYVGQVGPRPQIDKITVGGAPAATNTMSVTLGNSTLTVVLGTVGAASTNNAAATLMEAINARSVTSDLFGDEIRYSAGLQIGEFQDVVAWISDQDLSVVYVQSRVPGVVFGKPSSAVMSVAVTGGGVTLTRAAVQTATGPNDYSNTANWSGAATPSTGDAIYARYGRNGPMFGLPQTGSTIQPASITVDQTVSSGWSWGQPDIWTPTNLLSGVVPIPYRNYRPLATQFNAAHSGPTILNIGRGTGDGPSLFRSSWTTADADEVTGIIHNTGRPGPMGKCVYLNGSATNTGKIFINNGSVALATGVGEALGLGTNTTFGLMIGTQGPGGGPDVVVGAGVDLTDTYCLVQGGNTELRANINDSAATVAVLKVAGPGTVVKIMGSGAAGNPNVARLKILEGATVQVLSEMTIVTSRSTLSVEGVPVKNFKSLAKVEGSQETYMIFVGLIALII